MFDRERHCAGHLWSKPAHLLAFGFGAGCMPYAPGTLGTLVGIPVHLALVPLPAFVHALAILLLFGLGVRVCGQTAADLRVHDHPGIVWDEVVGFLITMYLAPPGPLWLLAGFALFRLFDIWKPVPIGWLDRNARGGFGIMIDDAAAGIYAAIVLLIGIRLAA